MVEHPLAWADMGRRRLRTRRSSVQILPPPPRAGHLFEGIMFTPPVRAPAADDKGPLGEPVGDQEPRQRARRSPRRALSVLGGRSRTRQRGGRGPRTDDRAGNAPRRRLRRLVVGSQAGPGRTLRRPALLAGSGEDDGRCFQESRAGPAAATAARGARPQPTLLEGSRDLSPWSVAAVRWPPAAPIRSVPTAGALGTLFSRAARHRIGPASAGCRRALILGGSSP